MRSMCGNSVFGEKHLCQPLHYFHARQGSRLEEEGEPAGYSLLVVEDTTDMLEFLAKNLGNTYTIHTAANGKEALECLETTTVDLIISDIVMPHMDGFELLKSIRSDNMLCHIPFILLSALDSIIQKLRVLTMARTLI